MLDPSEDAVAIGRHYEAATTLPRWRAGRSFTDGALHRPFEGAVMRLQSQLAAERLANAICAAALDQQAHGSVIATARSEIVFANTAAERLARGGGLILSSDGITCADKREAALLDMLIGSAAQGGPGGCTRISRGARRPILATTVAPLPVALAAELADMGTAPSLALVCVRDLGATSDAGQAQLIELFGLTGAEAAIVPQLLAGDSISLIAQSRGVSAATVRAQAARLLDKTGAANLRALAAMIAALGG